MNPVETLFFMKQMFDWRMVLDILMIASAMFFLYRTLIRLGTWKIVAGILIAMTIFMAASILDLKGIEWIYSNVSHVAVIAIIVIFQPELRKIFERAASVRKMEIGEHSEELIEIMVQSFSSLVQQRRGAIVVFPGREPIMEWISGGFNIDAEPSYPLVMSIFDPNSPGHDGAMIITNGRISRFGVRLPISQANRLTDYYGTRHHAAMGLSEKSDALIFVVSEERGLLSTFRNGKIRKVDEPKQLTRIIQNYWQENMSGLFEFNKAKKKWPIVFQMAVSIVLAIIFWSTLMVAQSEMLEKIVTVPVEYVSSPSNLIMVGDKVSEVRLHIAGPKSNLDSIIPSQLSVKIDLAKAVAGKQSFIITDQNIRLPKDVSLLDVTPPGFDLNLAEIVEHEITVKPQLVGKLPEGLKIHTITVKPEKIKVLSAATIGKGKEPNVSTTPIYLDSIYENTQIFCKIVAPPTIQPVEKPWPDVEVMISLKP